MPYVSADVLVSDLVSAAAQPLVDQFTPTTIVASPVAHPATIVPTYISRSMPSEAAAGLAVAHSATIVPTYIPRRMPSEAAAGLAVMATTPTSAGPAMLTKLF